MRNSLSNSKSRTNQIRQSGTSQVYFSHCFVYLYHILSVWQILDLASLTSLASHSKCRVTNKLLALLRSERYDMYDYAILCTISYYLYYLNSSHWRCCKKNCVLKIFSKFAGKHLARSLLFDNVACLNLFAVNFQKRNS